MKRSYVLNNYALLNNARSSGTKEKGLTPSDVCGGEALCDDPKKRLRRRLEKVETLFDFPFSSFSSGEPSFLTSPCCLTGVK